METTDYASRIELLKIAVQLIQLTKPNPGDVASKLDEVVAAVHRGFVSLAPANQPVPVGRTGPSVQRHE